MCQSKQVNVTLQPPNQNHQNQIALTIDDGPKETKRINQSINNHIWIILFFVYSSGIFFRFLKKNDKFTIFMATTNNYKITISICKNSINNRPTFVDNDWNQLSFIFLNWNSIHFFSFLLHNFFWKIRIEKVSCVCQMKTKNKL